ncbi:MAG: zf-HC2 domain-containing protein [Anaerolineales bacterium]
MTKTEQDKEKKMAALLQSHLYRHSCPAPEVLGLYQLNALSDEEKLVVAQHVRQCPHCQRELTELAAVEAPTSLRERLRRAKDLIEAQVVPTPQWRTAGLRGAGHPPQRFRTEALNIHLSQQPGYRHGRWMLLGRLEPRLKSASAATKIEGIKVWLMQGEETRETVVAADHTFAFEELMAGTYDMALEWHEQTIMIRGVHIR